MFRRLQSLVLIAVLASIAATTGVPSTTVFAQRGGAAPGPAQPQETTPPLLFREVWQQAAAARGVPTSPRRSQNQYWLAGQSAVTNPALELKLYGADAKNVTVYLHEGRVDLWTGLTGSPVAVLLRHRDHYLDLRGLARVRAVLRTGNLHTLHPAVRLLDGSIAAGSQRIDTDGQFLQTEVSFENQHWYALEADSLGVKGPVATVDLSRVDEVGFVDLAPAGGHGSSGWANVSTVEVFATPVSRAAAK
jgi:hypothetical protein